jgi:prevent-host-death family protein
MRSKEAVMTKIITANDLKTRGVTVLNEATDSGDEAVISVRGQNRFVVLPIEKYNYLRNCELEAAVNEAREDLKKGKIVKESVERHMKRITRA